MVKKKLTLSVDEEIIHQAKEQGINMSAFLEIRLTDYLRCDECGYRDLNPSKWLGKPLS